MQTRPLFRVSSPSRLRYHRIFFFFFFIISHLFFSSSVSSRFPFFFNRHVIRYDDTYTKKNKPNKRNNNTCVLFLVYIYIYIFFLVSNWYCELPIRFTRLSFITSDRFSKQRDEEKKRKRKKGRKKECIWVPSNACLLYAYCIERDLDVILTCVLRYVRV